MAQLVTTARAKEYLGITADDDNTLFDVLIKAVSDVIENYCKRTFTEAQFTEYFDGDDIKDYIVLGNYPVSAAEGKVIAIYYNSGTFGTPVWTAFNADNYKLITDEGMVYMDVMYAGKQNIKVVYTAGYAAGSIPDAIQLAVKKLVSAAYNQRKSDGVTNENAGPASINWGKIFTDDIKIMLDPYKRFSI